ncbi:RimJ/RimL family protein N-acetyltransferase [Luteibacter sp. OK325]|uniref:GNAT family N-acetyltransferase n=1 Tax=Luteibacter sp. OK325 TaxID=2135670 RepID=UPI000D34042A|nr:GNAT family N-acetyltransferase [Luteibacter sp. OK325]PTR32749.1 RimJ/RimL family protein N-acetyltransferase [Luteibacter sp. OK325]
MTTILREPTKFWSIETDRLSISEFGTDDAGFILELLNEPDFIKNIADRGVRDLAGAESYLLDGPLKSYTTHGFGLYKVALKPSGETIGMCGLIRRDSLDFPDLGYAFLAMHHRRGYASEAGAAVLDEARRERGIGRVVAITTLDNDGWIRVLENLGFRNEGVVIEMPDYDTPSRYFVNDP